MTHSYALLFMLFAEDAVLALSLLLAYSVQFLLIRS